MSELGLFGKIPAKGDFVRHNVVDDAARSFEQWMQEANDALRGAGGTLPEHPVRLVFTPPGSKKSVVAVAVPSQDSVGRAYPIVFFALVPVTETTSRFSALPQVYGKFLAAATALGAQAKTMQWDALRTAAAALSLPSQPERAHADELAEKALDYPLGAEVHGRLFGTSDMHFYAYQTFLTACQDAAQNDPGKAATVLDCPIHVDVDLFVWLELARRVYNFPPAHPQYFWTEDSKPRLLLSLGPAPLSLLQFLAQPDLEHTRLWPLLTERESAIRSAKEAMQSALDTWDERKSLATLLDCLVKRVESGTMR